MKLAKRDKEVAALFGLFVNVNRQDHIVKVLPSSGLDDKVMLHPHTLARLYTGPKQSNMFIHYIAKSIGTPPSNEQVLTTLVISMSTNLNV